MQKQQEVYEQYCKDIPARNNDDEIVVFAVNNISD